jgi:hypothetical protein
MFDTFDTESATTSFESFFKVEKFLRWLSPSSSSSGKSSSQMRKEGGVVVFRSQLDIFQVKYSIWTNK